MQREDRAFVGELAHLVDAQGLGGLQPVALDGRIGVDRAELAFGADEECSRGLADGIGDMLGRRSLVDDRQPVPDRIVDDELLVLDQGRRPQHRHERGHVRKQRMRAESTGGQLGKLQVGRGQHQPDEGIGRGLLWHRAEGGNHGAAGARGVIVAKLLERRNGGGIANRAKLPQGRLALSGAVAIETGLDFANHRAPGTAARQLLRSNSQRPGLLLGGGRLATLNGLQLDDRFLQIDLQGQRAEQVGPLLVD